MEDFVAKYFNGDDAQLLSPIIDKSADRFDFGLELEHKDKVDFKIKAKHFVKIYSQMASIIPYEIITWEKLFWFLKFLIPKLKVKDPDVDALDELLESVDLSSYGLQRLKLNQSIDLDLSETELDPQNPNPRGAHDSDKDLNPLDQIINTFNEKWFQGWSATPEEQRIKFVNIADSIKSHPDFEAKYKNNSDPHNRELAFEKILKEIMLQRRKDELELYKLFANDSSFKTAWIQSMEKVVSE